MFTTDSGVENFYVFDGSIGNILALINAAGVVTATYTYDPYGGYTTTSSTGSAAGLNPYRSAGGVYDRTTGFLKYGQRWYNPDTGRFTQQDSVEHLTDPAQGNRYTYSADNPVNHIDPTGKSFLGIGDPLACFLTVTATIIDFALLLGSIPADVLSGGTTTPLTYLAFIGLGIGISGRVYACRA